MKRPIPLFFVIVLLVISGCKKSGESPNNSSTKQTLYVNLTLNAGYTCSFNITDATTSDNPILYTVTNASGKNTYTFQITSGRVIGLDMTATNPQNGNGITQCGSIEFLGGGKTINTIAIYNDTTQTIVGTIP